MAASLVLPVVASVARKAADELVRTVTRMWGVDADRAKLERRLLAVQCLLADAEAKSETNPAVRRWMEDLRGAAYRADDVLARFEYEALRRQAAQRDRRSTTSKVLSHFTTRDDNPLLFRFRVSRELRDVLRKIDELVEEMNKFGLVEHAEAPPPVLYRQTHSSLDESEEVYGRDGNMADLVKLLLDHKQQHQQNVQVLPIIGMGGLGKTTLAKMLYNDIRVQSHFELKMWHCVSDNFEAPSLVRSVIESVTKGRCDLPDNIELLRGRLVDLVGRKRFLLVLDDVWNEVEHKWEDHLKPLLCSSIGGSGSVIVVTSRSKKVAAIMGTLPSHKLACLSEEDSWELFSKRAFSQGVQERDELVTLGKRIVDKCKGLPLALRTMGGLMSSKQLVKEWVDIADSNISDTSRGKDEVMCVLKLSYKHLSSEMKQCFAFCAFFPKDYQMEKDVLIQLWIANHFIHEEGMMDLTQKGEYIFNELVWRSFLQDVRKAARLWPPRIVHAGTIFCEMHDLMHDLAKDATEECASAEELIREKASINCVRHIKMSYPIQLEEIKALQKRASTLRTLFIESSHPLFVESRDADFVELKLKSLRALRCREPSLIKYSKYLHYLDLSGSDIFRLPDSISMLYDLQTLMLDRCCRLGYLHERLATSLRKLRHISLLGCSNLKEMPPNLSLLHNLSTLTKFVVGTKDGCGIEELKDLQQLSDILELSELRKVKSGSRANLHEKHNLYELSLDWCHGRSDILTNDDINNEEDVLESLVPPGEIKLLVIRGYQGREISQWMRDPQMFRCLKELSIYNWPRCKDIPLIWLSSSLEKLDLDHMDNLTTLCKNVAGYNNMQQVFPRLLRMTLLFLPNLERWTEEPHSLVMFPRLKELRVIDCWKLTTLPEAPHLTDLFCRNPNRIICPDNYCLEGYVGMSMPLAAWPSLVRLEVGLLANVDMSLEDHQGQNPDCLKSLRYLETMDDDAFASIFNIPKLQPDRLKALRYLEELNISNVNNIVRWPMEELRFLPRLTSMCILKCEKLGEEGLSLEEILPLPLLKNLEIRACDRLLEIPLLPPFLENLKICYCKRLVALPSNIGTLAKLRMLKVYNCDALKALPDRMDGLSSSLEALAIKHCPGIEEFPQGLLQRLPSLEELDIQGCPGLQRRCREGGEYFDLVSSIPRTDIETEQRDIERPTKRFLSFCCGDSQLSKDSDT